MDLYFNKEMEESLRHEAHLFELSPSAFVRVLIRIMKEPANQTWGELRIRVREIIHEENRRV